MSISRLKTIIPLVLFLSSVSLAQTTAFTYQGTLTDAGSPATGTYLLQFKLFDTAGTQIGSTIADVSVTAKNGIFSTSLDFGAAPFSGATRFLELAVKKLPGDPYTVLAPRQQILSVPYSIKSKSADDSTQLGGLASTRYLQQDATGNVSIGGNLSVSGAASYNIVNAQTQYNLNNKRVLSMTNGDSNLLLGVTSGQALTNGFFNTFIGNSAGAATSSGCCNTFVGTGAGTSNTTGGSNSFFGQSSGSANTLGSNNSYFGIAAGSLNVNGSDNAMFGVNAGFRNLASGNSFFGTDAGVENTTGDRNAFFGNGAGRLNTVGGSNSFFGSGTGANNRTGFSNSFFGGLAGTLNDDGIGNSFFGTFAGGVNTSGGANAFFGNSAGAANTSGGANSFFGDQAGFDLSTNIGVTTGARNTFIGRLAGKSVVTGSDNTFIGSGTTGTATLSFATALGAGASVTNNNTVVLGRSLDTVQIPGSLNANGSNLTSLNASNITLGTLSNSRLGLIPTANIADTAVTAAKIATGQVVKTLNGLTDGVSLAAGANITITPAGNTLTIASTGGGSNPILNQTTLQTTANFNIDGTGRANIFNANTQFNINGNRVLASTSESGTANLFAGFSAGASTNGAFNALVGTFAGQHITTGNNNSFFGVNAGGGEGSTGSDNVFIGNSAGFADGDGNRLTYIGTNTSNAPGFTLTNATAIGANARVTQNNSLVLGAITGVNGGTDTNVGVGTTAPKAKLDVTGGNILVGTAGQGIILKSPNGTTCRLLSIDNAGVIVLSNVTCP